MRVRRTLAAAGAALLLTACGGDGDAAKPEAGDSGRSAGGAAPTSKLCEGLDLAGVSAPFGGSAEVAADIVAGEQLPNIPEDAEAPQCLLTVGPDGGELSFAVTSKTDLEQSRNRVEQTTQTMSGAIDITCKPPVDVEVAGNPAVYVECAGDQPVRAVEVVVGDWALGCTWFPFQQREVAQADMVAACQAVLEHSTT